MSRLAPRTTRLNISSFHLHSDDILYPECNHIIKSHADWVFSKFRHMFQVLAPCLTRYSAIGARFQLWMDIYRCQKASATRRQGQNEAWRVSPCKYPCTVAAQTQQSCKASVTAQGKKPTPPRLAPHHHAISFPANFPSISFLSFPLLDRLDLTSPSQVFSSIKRKLRSFLSASNLLITFTISQI